MNTFYRRISLILAVIFLLDLILAPLASFAESIDAGDTLSLAVIARGSSPSQDMTGAVDTPTDDTASDETSSGLILTDEPSLEGGTGSIATGAILESSGMIDSPVISHDDETWTLSQMVDTMQWIDVFEGVAHPEREILIEFRKDISTMGLSSQTSLIADIENRQNITIDEMMLDGTIAIASIAPSPTLTVAFISDGADYIGTIETESSKQQWMDVLRSDPRIVSVQSNFVYELASTDSTFESLNTASQLIPFSDIQTISPQVLSGSNTGIIVGVLDTGIAYNHPELIDKMWDGTRCVSDTGAPLGGCIHGYDFGEGDLDPTEWDMYRGHGTHVAGIIERTMASGIASGSTVPRVQLMSLKVYGHKINATTWTIIKAINFAKQNGAKIISASFGSLWGHPQSDLDYDMLTYTAIKDFPGLFIAAAGNNGANTDYNKFYPAGFATDITVSGATMSGYTRVYSGSVTIPWLSNMLAIGAVDGNGARASFSNYGTGSVHIAAPGTSIASTYTTSIDSRNDTISIANGWIVENASHTWIFQSMSGETRIFTDTTSFMGSGIAYAKNENAYLSKSFSAIAWARHVMLQVPIWCNTPHSNMETKDPITLEYSTWGTFVQFKKLDQPTMFAQQGARPLVAYGHMGTFAMVTETIDVTADYTIRFWWHTDALDDRDPSTNTPYLWCFIEGGSGVTMTYYDDGERAQYTRLSGTSMATPHVSGIAALAWSLYPNRSRADIRSAILVSGDTDPSLTDTMISGRRANIEKTIATLASGTGGDGWGGSGSGSGSGVSVGMIVNHTVDIIRGNTAHISIMTTGSGTVGLSFWKVGSLSGWITFPSLSTTGSLTTTDIISLDFTTEYTYHISFCHQSVCAGSGMTGVFITPAGIALTFSGTATGSTSTYIEGSSASGYTATGTSRRILSLIHTGTLSAYLSCPTTSFHFYEECEYTDWVWKSAVRHFFWLAYRL